MSIPRNLATLADNVNASGVLGIAGGGTNSTATPTAGGVVYGTGTAQAATAAGTTGQALVSNAAGAPTFATLGVAGGGTNSTATPTAGGVGYGTGTAHAYSAVGTSGQVLTSAGTGTPTWSTPSAGALVYLSTVTASSASTADVETGFSSTYDNYLIVIDGLSGSVNYANLNVQFKLGGTYSGASYYGVQIYVGASASYPETANYQNAAVYGSAGSVPNSNTRPAGYSLNIYNANNISTTKMVTASGGFYDTGAYGCFSSRSSITTSTAGVLTGIRFSQSSGTFSGNFRLYGVAKA